MTTTKTLFLRPDYVANFSPGGNDDQGVEE